MQRGWRPLEQAGVSLLQHEMRLFKQVGEQPLLDEEELDEEEEDPPELEEELDEEQVYEQKASLGKNSKVFSSKQPCS